MKKKYFIVCLLLITFKSYAQPWLNTNSTKMNLQEIKTQYDQYKKTHPVKEDEKLNKAEAVKEGQDYLFDRWYWNAQRHTDEQGNLITTQKNYTEWLKYNAYKKGAKITATDSSDWKFQGPDSSNSGYMGIGRIQTICFHPTGINTYWIGSANGGAWKTTDDGTTWTNMTPNIPVFGIADIDYNPLNTQTIYLTTGDQDQQDTHSVGVLKSVDGGSTWTDLGPVWATTSNVQATSLIVNTSDTNHLVLSSSLGIYKSSDGGATWALVISGPIKQLASHPNKSNIIYAATNNSILRSLDTGNSWVTVHTFSNANRVALATTPAAPNMLKAVVSNNLSGLEGVYSSADSGTTFILKLSGSDCSKNILSGDDILSSASCNGQGWYDLAIAIAPDDSNKVVVGGINSYYSTDGGTTFQKATQWYGGNPGIMTVHADKHFLAYQPTRPNTLFEGNDGGIYRTISPTSLLWNDLTNGIGISQFYRLAVSNVAPFAIGGLQDNGTKMVQNGQAAELTGGDGMDCEMDYSDPNTFYTSSQYGHFNKTTDGGMSFFPIYVAGAPAGAWVTPLIISPFDPNTLYAGYDQVYESNDGGMSWNTISPVFDPNNAISRIAATASDHQVLYVIIPNTIRYTTNGGATWLTQPITGFTGSFSDIYIDPKNARHFWVTYSGYGTRKVAEYDLLNGWVNKSNGIPDVPVHCFTLDTSNLTQYIGTDLGVFYKDTTMSQWASYNNNLPPITVNDLDIKYDTKEIYAATFGRGIWKSKKRNFLSNTGILNIESKASFSLYPNPNTGNFTILLNNPKWHNTAITITIYNTQGQTVWMEKKTANGAVLKINSTLASGSYSLELKNTKNESSRMVFNIVK